MPKQTTLELAVGETILIGNRTVTLLDIEGDSVLLQLSADDEVHALTAEEFGALLAIASDSPSVPR